MKTKLTSLKSRAGFGIAEFTVFSGLILAILAASYQLINKSVIARKQAKLVMNYLQFTNYVQTVTTDQTSCGVGFGLLNPLTGTPVAQGNFSPKTIKLNLPPPPAPTPTPTPWVPQDVANCQRLNTTPSIVYLMTAIGPDQWTDDQRNNVIHHLNSLMPNYYPSVPNLQHSGNNTLLQYLQNGCRMTENDVPGNWKATCNNSQLTGSILSASCGDGKGNSKQTSYDVSLCTKDGLNNIWGDLQCITLAPVLPIPSPSPSPKPILIPSQPTNITLHTATGEEYSLNSVIGGVKLTDISVTLFGPGVPVPGPTPATDLIYSATLNISGTQLQRTQAPIAPLSIPISIRAKANSGVMVSCSSYRDSSHNLITSPPCDQYSVADVSGNGNTVSCKKVFCATGQIPTGFTPSGEVQCESIKSCTGSGMGLVNVAGHYKCKQLSCPEEGQLPYAQDSDGFIIGCLDIAQMIIPDCERTTNNPCKPLANGKFDPKAYGGKYCAVDKPANRGKFCLRNCADEGIFAPEDTCYVAKPSPGLSFSENTAQSCLNIGGTLVPDPNPATTMPGRLVCMIQTPKQGENPSCPAGWKTYGKHYQPDMNECPADVAHNLDWHGRGDCWPNCLGQGDSFPEPFAKSAEGTAAASQSCSNWLQGQIDKKSGNPLYRTQMGGDGVQRMTIPTQTVLPRGYFSEETGNNIDIHKQGCFTSIDCRLCRGDMTEIQRIFFNAFIYGAVTLGTMGTNLIAGGVAAAVIMGQGGDQLNEEEDKGLHQISTFFANSECGQPNISWVFNRCDLNCYVSGPSNCKMAPSVKIRKVKYSVATYCY